MGPRTHFSVRVGVPIGVTSAQSATGVRLRRVVTALVEGADIGEAGCLAAAAMES